MRVALGVLADYANVTADGKLNIMGVFQIVYAAQFPYVHPQMHLVLTLEADPSEAGNKKQLEIKLMGPDGAPLLAVGGELEVPKGSPFPGAAIGLNHILGFQGVRFDKPGDYQFAVLVGGDHKQSIRLKVLQVTPGPPPG